MSDIPMLQGWGEGLGQLGNGLSTLINPHQAQQAAFRKAALENPNLIAQYGEMERANPGTLAKMGLGNMTGQISTSSITPEMQQSRDTSKADIAYKGALKTNTEANTNRTNTLTPDEARKGKVEADVAEGTKDNEIANKNAQHKLAAQNSVAQLDSTALALKKYPSLAGIDMAKYASDVFNGVKTDPQLATRIAAAGPEGEKTIKQYLDAMHLHAQLASEGDIAHLRSKDEALATAGVFNLSIREAQQHERLLKDEIIKIGGDEMAQFLLQHNANPKDETLRNSPTAVEARTKLEQIKNLKEQMTQIKEGYDKLTVARDNILNSVKAVQAIGGMAESSKLGPTAKAIADKLEKGEFSSIQVQESDAYKALTTAEKSELRKIKSKKVTPN